MKVISYTCIALATACVLVSMLCVAMDEIVASRVLLTATAVLFYGAWQSAKRVNK